MEQSNVYRIRPKFDYVLFLSIWALVLIGILMVYSSSYPIGIKEKNNGTYFFMRHLVFILIGTIAMFVAMVFPLKTLRKYSGFIWLMTVGLCIIPFFSPPIENTYRWINVFNKFTLQPSDLLKVSAALHFPVILSRTRKSDVERLVFSLGFIGLNVGLVYLQRDLSTALVIAAALFVMYFVTTMKIGEAMVYAMAVPVGVFYIANKGFRSNRIKAFLDPFSDSLNVGWHTIQGMYAVANGGLLGVGIGNSIQKYFYVYAAYSDYAFAIVVEELGFVRAALILLCYFFISFKFITYGLRMMDTFTSTFLIAVGTYIGFQSLVHMGVVVNAVPSTGITLPFISYGGTSILAYFTMVGLAFNILNHCPRRELK